VDGRSLLQGNFTKNLSQNEKKTFKRIKMLHDWKIGLQNNRGENCKEEERSVIFCLK
jgi:hypothetical protein